jgi:hypothetical protein
MSALVQARPNLQHQSKPSPIQTVAVAVEGSGVSWGSSLRVLVAYNASNSAASVGKVLPPAAKHHIL